MTIISHWVLLINHWVKLWIKQSCLLTQFTYIPRVSFEDGSVGHGMEKGPKCPIATAIVVSVKFVLWGVDCHDLKSDFNQVSFSRKIWGNNLENKPDWIWVLPSVPGLQRQTLGLPHLGSCRICLAIRPKCPCTRSPQGRLRSPTLQRWNLDNNFDII